MSGLMLMCWGGGLEWFRTRLIGQIGVKQTGEGWDRSADQVPSGSVPRHQGGRGGTPGTPLGLTSTSLLVLSTGWF